MGILFEVTSVKSYIRDSKPVHYSLFHTSLYGMITKQINRLDSSKHQPDEGL